MIRFFFVESSTRPIAAGRPWLVVRDGAELATLAASGRGLDEDQLRLVRAVQRRVERDGDQDLDVVSSRAVFQVYSVGSVHA